MTASDPIARFDGKTISYTYDNGWSFTNSFDGHTRISEVPGRGELREYIQMVEVRPGLFFASWIDDEMGLLAQIIDVETGAVLAAIPTDGPDGTEILNGKLTASGD